MKAKISSVIAALILALFLSGCGSKDVKPDTSLAGIEKTGTLKEKDADKNVTGEKSLEKKSSEKEHIKKSEKPDISDENEEDEEELSDEELDELDEEENDDVTVVESDPLYYFNVSMFHVTDKTYYWVLKPLAQCYRFVMPEMVRIWVRNFFYNLGMPVRFVGNLLQFKLKDASKELGRFLLNSTVGILGFGNPSGYFESLTPTAEDIGQAFGKWGIGEGFFIFLPFLGPSTLRDSVSLAGEMFLDPVYYTKLNTIEHLSITGFKYVNNVSLQLGTYEAIKEAALDPYEAIRDGYLQRRRKEVAD